MGNGPPISRIVNAKKCTSPGLTPVSTRSIPCSAKSARGQMRIAGFQRTKLLLHRGLALVCLIVKSHTRPEFFPSLTIIFRTLLWQPTNPQYGGVVLHRLTVRKNLWYARSIESGAGDVRFLFRAGWADLHLADH